MEGHSHLPSSSRSCVPGQPRRSEDEVHPLKASGGVNGGINGTASWESINGGPTKIWGEVTSWRGERKTWRYAAIAPPGSSSHLPTHPPGGGTRPIGGLFSSPSPIMEERSEYGGSDRSSSYWMGSEHPSSIPERLASKQPHPHPPIHQLPSSPSSPPAPRKASQGQLPSPLKGEVSKEVERQLRDWALAADELSDAARTARFDHRLAIRCRDALGQALHVMEQFHYEVLRFCIECSPGFIDNGFACFLAEGEKADVWHTKMARRSVLPNFDDDGHAAGWPVTSEQEWFKGGKSRTSKNNASRPDGPSSVSGSDGVGASSNSSPPHGAVTSRPAAASNNRKDGRQSRPERYNSHRGPPQIKLRQTSVVDFSDWIRDMEMAVDSYAVGFYRGVGVQEEGGDVDVTVASSRNEEPRTFSLLSCHTEEGFVMDPPSTPPKKGTGPESSPRKDSTLTSGAEAGGSGTTAAAGSTGETTPEPDPQPVAASPPSLNGTTSSVKKGKQPEQTTTLTTTPGGPNPSSPPPDGPSRIDSPISTTISTVSAGSPIANARSHVRFAPPPVLSPKTSSSSSAVAQAKLSRCLASAIAEVHLLTKLLNDLNSRLRTNYHNLPDIFRRDFLSRIHAKAESLPFATFCFQRHLRNQTGELRGLVSQLLIAAAKEAERRRLIEEALTTSLADDDDNDDEDDDGDDGVGEDEDGDGWRRRRRPSDNTPLPLPRRNRNSRSPPPPLRKRLSHGHEYDDEDEVDLPSMSGALQQHHHLLRDSHRAAAAVALEGSGSGSTSSGNRKPSSKPSKLATANGHSASAGFISRIVSANSSDAAAAATAYDDTWRGRAHRGMHKRLATVENGCLSFISRVGGSGGGSLAGEWATKRKSKVAERLRRKTGGWDGVFDVDGRVGRRANTTPGSHHHRHRYPTASAPVVVPRPAPPPPPPSSTSGVRGGSAGGGGVVAYRQDDDEGVVDDVPLWGAGGGDGHRRRSSGLYGSGNHRGGGEGPGTGSRIKNRLKGFFGFKSSSSSSKGKGKGKGKEKKNNNMGRSAEPGNIFPSHEAHHHHGTASPRCHPAGGVRGLPIRRIDLDQDHDHLVGVDVGDDVVRRDQGVRFQPR